MPKKSVLDGIHLKIECIIKFIYMGSVDYTQIKMFEELGIDKNTCVLWSLKIRGLIEADIVSDGNILGIKYGRES